MLYLVSKDGGFMLSYVEEGFVDKRFAHSHKRKRKVEVHQLWEVHHEIARRIALGEKNADIARELGVTPVMVSYTRNSRIVQDKISIMRGAMDADTIDLGRRIQEIAPRALDLIEDVIEGKGAGKEAPIGLRVREAESIMDRAGYSAVKKVMGVQAHFTAQDIERIKARAKANRIIVDGSADQEHQGA